MSNQPEQSPPPKQSGKWGEINSILVNFSQQHEQDRIYGVIPQSSGGETKKQQLYLQLNQDLAKINHQDLAKIGDEQFLEILGRIYWLNQEGLNGDTSSSSELDGGRSPLGTVDSIDDEWLLEPEEIPDTAYQKFLDQLESSLETWPDADKLNILSGLFKFWEQVSNRCDKIITDQDDKFGSSDDSDLDPLREEGLYQNSEMMPEFNLNIVDVFAEDASKVMIEISRMANRLLPDSGEAFGNGVNYLGYSEKETSATALDLVDSLAVALKHRDNDASLIEAATASIPHDIVDEVRDSSFDTADAEEWCFLMQNQVESKDLNNWYLTRFCVFGSDHILKLIREIKESPERFYRVESRQIQQPSTSVSLN